MLLQIRLVLNPSKGFYSRHAIQEQIDSASAYLNSFVGSKIDDFGFFKNDFFPFYSNQLLATGDLTLISC